MGNIIIYSDLHKTYTDQFDVLVKQIEDYVNTYKRILEAIYDKKALVIIVRNQYCLNALSKMCERYPEYLAIMVNSPRERLEKSIGFTIPQYITDEEIVSNQLSEEINKIAFNKSMSFEDNILNHYIGNHLTHTRFPFARITDLLLSVEKNSMYDLNKYGILDKIYKRRLKLWEGNCKEDYQKNILDEYKNDPGRLLVKLSKYSILKNYPKQIINDVVGDIAKDFEKLGLKDEPFIARDMNTIDIQRNITIYLNQISVTELSKDDIEDYIFRLSGLFMEELEFAYKMLQRNQEELEASILQKMRQKFKTGSQLDLMFNEKLNNLIPPRKVDRPSELNSLSEWFDWARSSYLPYKFWMESNDVADADIDDYSSMYGEWIFNHYDSLISSENRMLFKTIANISAALKEDELSIIVMIDNLNYKFVPLCKLYLNQKGYSTTMDQPLVSMIPTETAVSKTAFFSGQPFNTQQKTYETMCKEWETFLGCSVQYLSDIGKLDSVKEKTSRIYLLNYLSIDRILHESQNNSALPITFRIQEELKAMMNKVLSFGKRLGFENKIKIYFTSDHGSTKISKEQMNLIDAKYHKSITDDSAYRVIALKDNKFDIYKDNIGHLCYVLDRQHYGIKENYLIAKGYSRFMETNLSFYVHGGLTPEENIVPLLKFERINVNLSPLDILLRTREFRYSVMTSIQFTIKNYNEYPMSNIEIAILNSNVRWDQGIYTLSEIRKESQLDVRLDNIRILKTNNKQEKLHLKIGFNFMGKDYEEKYEFALNMKSTQENKFNLDDLF